MCCFEPTDQIFIFLLWWFSEILKDIGFFLVLANYNPLKPRIAELLYPFHIFDCIDRSRNDNLPFIPSYKVKFIFLQLNDRSFWYIFLLVVGRFLFFIRIY